MKERQLEGVTWLDGILNGTCLAWVIAQQGQPSQLLAALTCWLPSLPCEMLPGSWQQRRQRPQAGGQGWHAPAQIMF